MVSTASFEQVPTGDCTFDSSKDVLLNCEESVNALAISDPFLAEQPLRPLLCDTPIIADDIFYWPATKQSQSWSGNHAFYESPEDEDLAEVCCGPSLCQITTED